MKKLTPAMVKACMRQLKTFEKVKRRLQQKKTHKRWMAFQKALRKTEKVCEGRR